MTRGRNTKGTYGSISFRMWNQRPGQCLANIPAIQSSGMNLRVKYPINIRTKGRNPGYFKYCLDQITNILNLFVVSTDGVMMVQYT